MQLVFSEERDLYFEWLCCLVCATEADFGLLLGLYSCEFRWSIPRDENRAMDGHRLRGEVENIMNYTDLPISYCTVLEALIGIARRMDAMRAEPRTDNTPRWFWEIVGNLGFDPDLSNFYEVIDRFLNREYNLNGDGGLFPLNQFCEDQRKVEIWYQMNAYMMEKHPV